MDNVYRSQYHCLSQTCAFIQRLYTLAMRCGVASVDYGEKKPQGKALCREEFQAAHNRDACLSWSPIADKMRL
jgi:hypothetical protein